MRYAYNKTYYFVFEENPEELKRFLKELKTRFDIDTSKFCVFEENDRCCLTSSNGVTYNLSDGNIVCFEKDGQNSWFNLSEDYDELEAMYNFFDDEYEM